DTAAAGRRGGREDQPDPRRKSVTVRIVNTGEGRGAAVLRLGLSTLGCPNYDIGRIIRTASDNGFAGAELRSLHGTTDLPSPAELTPGRIEDTRRCFEDAGIRVVAIGTSVRMTSLEPDVRRQQLQAARANTAIAAGLGAPYLRVFGRSEEH